MKVDSSDKPWISPEIKDLIPKRQAAWNSGNMDAFRLYIETKLMRCARVPVQGIIIITSLIHCNQIHTSGGPLLRRSLVWLQVIISLLSFITESPIQILI